jgi:endoglucanase
MIPRYTIYKKLFEFGPPGRFAWAALLAFALPLGLGAPLPAESSPVTQDIRMDYFGYRPADGKVAVFSADPGAVVQVRDAAENVIFEIPSDGGSIVSKGYDGPPSGDNVWWVDFSPFEGLGEYHLYSPALGAQSYDFEIGWDVYNDVVAAAARAFYYQRCNTPKAATYSGDWADHYPCHMADTTVTATPGTTDYGTRDLTGGWHDAGDYNKYVWTAASTAVFCLLRAYEDNPSLFTDGGLDIPESGNTIPDILDEVKWELDWLLKMRLPGGAVLHDIHVLGWNADAPPSSDANVRYYSWYSEPNVESAAVLAGCCAYGSRIFRDTGLGDYADSLSSAALETWAWLMPQGDHDTKAWAAAEIFRMDGSVTTARDYVDSYYSNNWAGRFFNAGAYDTHAAITYIQTPAATPATVTNMETSVGGQVDYIFGVDDLYRNGMPDWSYHWGSNSMRAFYGMFLVKAALLDLTGAHSEQECLEHALDFLHFMHGQNPMNMVYLSNMAFLGGEHSSYQFYHAWFGNSRDSYSRDTYVGKPAAVNEPAYPYFSGIDNMGTGDDNSSAVGPAPGFVPGGPNSNYSGIAIPPAGATYYNRYYRDWCENDLMAEAKPWEITENSIGYQGPYVCLASYFMGADVKETPAARSVVMALGVIALAIIAARRLHSKDAHSTEPGRPL